MEFLLNDPHIQRLPPEQTRLLDLQVVPYPDQRRLRIALEITPFQKRPNIEIALTDPAGNPAGSTSIVEPMGWKLELTLHVRPQVSPPPVGTFHLTACLSYPDLPDLDRRTIPVELTAPSE
jgi:hypothetical protein